MKKLKVGCSVNIIRKDIFALNHRKYPVKGTVVSIDGSYIMVRPSWCKWVIELYPCEIELN